MLFLLNDTVLKLDGDALGEKLHGAHLDRLSLATVTAIGQELFANDPRLQQHSEETARRLAILICTAEPSINAALFLAPRAGCRPSEVTSRYVDAGIEVIGHLYALQKQGNLDVVGVHQEVWLRAAA